MKRRSKATKTTNGAVQTEITFEKLPGAVAEILKRLGNIETKLDELTEEDERFSVTGVARYLNFSRNKVYSLMGEEEIPFHEVAGKNIFIKSEVDAWLKGVGDE